MVMMSWRHGVRLSWVLFVTAVAWNPSLLNTVTFDPFTLPSLPVDRRVLSSTVNPNVSFPSNDVLVNIRPLLISQASSKGGRLDPTCAKKNKTKHVKTEKGWTDGSSAFSQFVCLLLFSRRKKGENTMEKKKKMCWPISLWRLLSEKLEADVFVRRWRKNCTFMKMFFMF